MATKAWATGHSLWGLDVAALRESVQRSRYIGGKNTFHSLP